MKLQILYTFILSVLCSCQVYSQSEKIKLFLEPTVSIELDSKSFEVEESNDENRSYLLDENKSNYTLRFRDKKLKNVFVEISVEYSSVTPSKEELNIAIQKQIEQLKASEKILEISKLDYKGFVGYGSRLEKANKKEQNTGGVYHKYFDGVKCAIFVGATNNKVPYEQIHDKILKLIDGITMFKKSDFEEKHQHIREQIIIKVDSIGKTKTIKSVEATYVAQVIAEGIDSEKINGVTLYNASGRFQGRFEFIQDGKVIIFTNDSEKGKITKKCILYILDSFGKKVQIPFEFSYYNE
ncbi:hypothetical protein ACE193_09915 [Bernardetia sp. OM2101]|uniref:hypothetical protein n=1 Tax=Bernardetia sp. OM2101 TaxID=3344876 RepID=UPI0035CFAC81